MRIYLDACCLNRPFDDQAQDRIRVESEAVRAILNAVERGLHQWVSSVVLEDELLRNPDPQRREVIFRWLRWADERAMVTPAAALLARNWTTAGLGAMDALHVAVADAAGCDILLTTDDAMLRRGSRLDPPARVRIANPAHWLLEVGTP